MFQAKVYVASKYENKALIAEMVRTLEMQGFRVTSTWHKEHWDATVQLHEVSDKELRETAWRDVHEIEQSNIVLVVTEGCENSRGGMHFETGYGWAEEKKIVVLGPKIHVFHHLTGVAQVDTLEEFIKCYGAF